MIDEELYKIATDELNSDKRKPDVWARACALARNDHDEARYLYTNLRVEEMLHADGKQPTFDAEKHRENKTKQRSNLSDAEKLGDLELNLDEEDVVDEKSGTVSSRTGVDSKNKSTPLPIDDIVDFEHDAEEAPSSVAGNAIVKDNELVLDDDTLSEIDQLSAENAKTEGAVSSVTGMSVADYSRLRIGEEEGDSSPAMSELMRMAASNKADREAKEKTQANEIANAETDKSQPIDKASDIADLDSDEYILDDVIPEVEQPDNVLTTEEAVTAAVDEPAAKASIDEQSEILADYADDEILNIDESDEDLVNLDTGAGRSYMVFGRNGAMKAVKRGVSWPAFFFTLPWLLSKQLFGTALMYIALWVVAIGGLLITASNWINAVPDASTAIKLWTAAFFLLTLIGLFYIPFRYGNKWVAEKLQNRGFKLETAVGANNKREAIDQMLRATD